jgi:hypothetical protein
MNKYYKLLVTLIFVICFNITFAQNKDDIVILCDNYDSLYNAIKSGVPASMKKIAYISEFSLVEKSMITVYPKSATDEGYPVEFSILSLEKGEASDAYETNSVLGFILKGCKGVDNKYKLFNKTSCKFFAGNPNDALEAAKNGISSRIDEVYLLEGSLVDVFRKICAIDDPGQTVDKKPAVYLYPAERMDVSVQVKVNGGLLFTEPDYNTGWNVNVTPEGIIDSKYDYLFYEASLNKIELPNEGWVVEFENLKSWFDEYLPKLGLNKKEKEQFEDYWLSKLRKSKYYDIRLLDDKFLSENMDLIINPKPETLLRLNFYFKPINSKIDLTAPEIKEVTRKGFTVIEWGGINSGDLRIFP